MARTTKTETPEAPKGLEVISNNKFEIVDNTAAEAQPEVPVTATEVPLLGDFVQVNYL